MSGSSARVFAPASVSNVACGFDTLGFAITALGDVVEARVIERRADAVRIAKVSGDRGRLPDDAERNTAAVAASAVQHLFALAHPDLARTFSLELEIEKRMPLSSGLGSSAASAVAGTVATAELLGEIAAGEGVTFELSDAKRLDCALAGELVASGGRHADNVAPSMLGGFVLVRSVEREPDVVRLPDCSDWLWCALVRPDLSIDTLGSRQRLGTRVPLPIAIRQWSNLGALVHALHSRDLDLLQRALVDHVAEPTRKREVPGFDEAMIAARRAGALGGSLSGSGPTLFALAPSAAEADGAADAMAAALGDRGAGPCDLHVSPVGAPGARRVDDT